MKVNLMLDSGAFTAWKKNEPLDVRPYIRWCLSHQEDLFCAVNLDVIPGRFGRTPTSDDVEHAATCSWSNYEAMSKAGVPTMPVYHFGERIYWLEKMLDSGCDYIGIGGLVGVATKYRRRWLDQVFREICGSNPYPSVRVHGFGVTAVPVIQAYPWYSVDSSAWVRRGATGWMNVPVPNADGTPDWQSNYMGVLITDHALQGSPDSQRWEFLSRGAQAWVKNYYANLGYDWEELRTNHYVRKRANAHYFKQLSEHLAPHPFGAAAIRTLTGQMGGENRGSLRALNPTVRVFLVFSPADEQSKMLTEIGHADRLCSYLYLRGSSYDVNHFVNNGIPRRRKRRIKLEK